MKNFQIINLKTLKNNAINVKNKLDGNCKFCAVIKADAYGHGGVKVANALYTIADCFAVALLEEAIELRLSGIDKDVLVLLPVFEEDIGKAVANDLTLTVDCERQIKQINEESKRQNKITKVHIKYNTGMNRNGIDDEVALKQILLRIKECKNVYLDGFYSHFACPQNKKLRNEALSKFSLAIKLIKEYNKNAICHISSSGGFLIGKSNFDMVRIGLLLYGYKPFASRKVSVKPCMKLKIPVIKQRTIHCGQGALYGDKVVSNSVDLSLIRYGYADGLDRREIDGQFNNRCMDVSAVKGRYGRFYVIEDMQKIAEKYGTIPYEILTKIGIRAEKVYIE